MNYRPNNCCCLFETFDSIYGDLKWENPFDT